MIARQLLAPFSGPLVMVAKAGESGPEFEVITTVRDVKVVSRWRGFGRVFSV
jgi:hypothetical protein